MAYRTTVHHTVLRSEYDRTVGQWGRDTLRKMETRAIRTAPRRGGHKSENLAAQHGPFFGVSGAGGYTLNLNLWNDASYARYVHQGTTGPIRARGSFMVFPGSEIGSSRYMVRLRTVHGQASQPWMRDALEFTMRSEGILSPVISEGI